MDGLTKLLLTKYNPGKLQELLQEPLAVTKSESSSVQGPTPKSAPEAIHAASGFILIMDAAQFSEEVIYKSMREFNAANADLMSRSFMLPVAMYGLQANSWIFSLPKDV